MRNNHIYIYSNNAFYFWRGDVVDNQILFYCSCMLHFISVVNSISLSKASRIIFLLHALQRINNFVGVGHDTA